MEQFTIYYGTLPNGRRKIGVDQKYPTRIIDQKLTDHRVMEVHTDVYEVSDRERELQRLHGVKVDKVPYHVIYFMSKDPNWRAKVSAGSVGKVLSKEHKRKISESRLGKFKPTTSTKLKMSESHKGMVFSKEHKENLKGPKIKVTCPHCSKEGGKPVMMRYHFDKCKHINV